MNMSMNLSEALLPPVQQFVAALRDTGWNDTETRNLARLWSVAEEDINAILGTPPNTDPHTTEIRIGIIAAQVSHAINVRCRPSTPAIVNAAPEQLLEWIDFYETECDRIYRELIQAQVTHPEGKTVGNSVWEAAWAQFTRIAGFLWEANEVAGVNSLMSNVGEGASA